MVRVKICGIRHVDDGLAVAKSGADAIGFVFYPSSPRAIDITTATEISRAVGPFLTTVALFVNPEPDCVREVLERVSPHTLQFHGDESAEFCEQFDRPYLKAIRVNTETNIEAETARFLGASGFVFDAWSEDLYGGTGKTFDWNRIRGFTGAPVVLAGGLTASNVVEAIGLTRPYAVDVSGGVERAPGDKDPEKIRQFVNQARQAI